MKLLKSIPWRRVIGIVAGAATTYEAAQGALPPWAQVVGGLVIGAAVNAEKVFAKRSKGAPTFNTAEAATKVEKMR